ncbi:MAG: aminomethyl-transferring glycine dehydrogenase subunit GcvPB, partial [Calditrichia bacterium]|nr:aminomethyl-transferring glycine dehydrogenase subunit GcvPB [Calditrichia bacterium]
KTFSTPHGGGGPGSGPVAVSEKLKDYLPVPVVKKNSEGKFVFDHSLEHTIGRVSPYYGNFGVCLRAYAYILSLGKEGLVKTSQHAIINANYLLKKIEKFFVNPFTTSTMHEFVLSGDSLKEYGLKALDWAKRLLDYGFHAPTVYFPLIVREAIMVEPTESESKEMLDQFADVVEKIFEEAKQDPEILKNAPVNTPVRRLNEVKANKELNIVWNE